MLQNSGKVLDNASPIITSRLAKNIRISVIKTPVLDEDAGVAASIRIVNPRNLSKADFVQSGTATEEMLDFFVRLPALWRVYLRGGSNFLRQDHRGGLASLHHPGPQAYLYH